MVLIGYMCMIVPKLLDIEEEFSILNRYLGIEDKKSKFQIKNLSSAALGDNTLKFYEMKGRVQIDFIEGCSKRS